MQQKGAENMEQAGKNTILLVRGTAAEPVGPVRVCSRTAGCTGSDGIRP